MRFDPRVLLVCGAIVAATGAPVQAQTVFAYSSFIPWTHPVNTSIYIPWMEAVEKATEGRVTFQHLPQPVAAPPAHIDAVRTGQADAAMSVYDYSPKRFAPYTFGQLPFLGDRALHSSVAMWRTHEKYFAEKDLHRGVHFIGLNTHGPGHLHVRTRGVETLADVRGLKIRTPGPIPLQIVEAWGGVSVRQPAPKSYELLSTGIVDGIAFPWESVPSFNLTELVRFTTEFPGGLYTSNHYLVISKKKYDSLSDADRKAIDDLSGEAWSRRAGEAWDKLNDAGRETVRKAGAKIVTASGELLASVEKLNEKFEADYIELVKEMGLDGREVLDFFRAEVKKLAAN